MSELESPDVSAILNELRDSVRRHQPLSDAAASDEQPARWRQLDLLLDRLRRSAIVNPHLPIAWPEWPPGLIPKLRAVAQKLIRRALRWYINPIVDQQNEFNRTLLHTTTELSMHVKGVWEQAGYLQQRNETLQERIGRIERRTRAAPAASAAAAAAPLESPPPSSPPAAGYGHVDYFLLELTYRGSPADIQQRQRVYLDDLAHCRTVLDVGCGRGEFVALLRESGIDARGIDLDPETVAYCQEKGLPVEQAEAITYLSALDDQTLDGVFMAQVVEHLEPAALVRLLDLALQKLRPGGVLVAETINPACLFALANHYLIDPSHVQPVHPRLLEFLVKTAGFVDVRIRYQSPMPEGARLERLSPPPGDPGQTALMNRNIDRLNETLFGYQDYALIARRLAAELDQDNG